MKLKDKRPIYKQIISGICYGILLCLFLYVITYIILGIMIIMQNPIGNVLCRLFAILIIVPAFILTFQWSLTE